MLNFTSYKFHNIFKQKVITELFKGTLKYIWLKNIIFPRNLCVGNGQVYI